MTQDIQSAVEYYVNLSRQNPNDLEVIMNLAWIYQRAGQHQYAIDYFNRALSMDNQNAHLYYGLGLAYMGNGQADKATEALRSAYQLAASFDDRAEKTVMSKQIESYMRLLEATG